MPPVDPRAEYHDDRPMARFILIAAAMGLLLALLATCSSCARPGQVADSGEQRAEPRLQIELVFAGAQFALSTAQMVAVEEGDVQACLVAAAASAGLAGAEEHWERLAVQPPGPPAPRIAGQVGDRVPVEIHVDVAPCAALGHIDELIDPELDGQLRAVLATVDDALELAAVAACSTAGDEQACYGFELAAAVAGASRDIYDRVVVALQAGARGEVKIDVEVVPMPLVRFQ